MNMTVTEALAAANQAHAENLRGTYPAAARVLACEHDRLHADVAALRAQRDELAAALRPFAELPTASETPGVARDPEGDEDIYRARAALAKLGGGK